MNIRILSTGIAIPEHIVTNDDLSMLVKNYDEEKSHKSLNEWVIAHYGIHERRWMKDGELPSGLAAKACKAALDRAGLSASDIDFMILNTAYGDYSQPTTATAIQKKIGMKSGTFALEINMPCSGPVYSFVLALQLIRSGKYKKCLLVGVDRMSSFIDKSDFMMATLFGDAAGACIVEVSERDGLEDFYLSSKGEDIASPALIIPGGKAASPIVNEENPNRLLMNGKLVNEFIGSAFEDTIRNLAKTSIAEFNASIDHIIPHQASLKAIEKHIANAGLSISKLEMTLKYLGNTSSASIYITLDQLLRRTDIKGKKLFMIGLGGGLNWGGLIYRHSDQP